MRLLLSCCLSIFCLASVLAQGTSFEERNSHLDLETHIFRSVDTWPTYPGCNEKEGKEELVCAKDAFNLYISQNLQYPDKAKAKGKEGLVEFSYVVNRDGSIGPVYIMKDIGKGCGDEVKRLMQSMNEAGIKWNPGKVEDTPVRTKLYRSIEFKLK